MIARLRFHRRLAGRTKLRAKPGEEQPDEMIDLRDGGHRALAAAARGALLNADRGGQAGDEVHIGPRHLLHELPRVGVHGIEEAALPLGENQIKGQRALARAAHAGDDDKFPARQVERDVFQVVLPRAEDADDLGNVTQFRRGGGVHAQSSNTGRSGCNRGRLGGSIFLVGQQLVNGLCRVCGNNSLNTERFSSLLSRDA